MDNISELITRFTLNHKEERKGRYSKTKNTDIITHTLPALFEWFVSDQYTVNWSVWKWQWSEIPWIAMLDEQVTLSTRNWYYIVLLFDNELENIYFSLWVWWTQFQEEYWTKEWKERVRKYCSYYATQLENSDWFNSDIISLWAEKQLGKWYELCQILTKKVNIKSLTDENIYADINQLNKLFKQLKLLVWSSILNNPLNEEESRVNFDQEVVLSSLEPNTNNALNELILKASKEIPKTKKVYFKKIVRNRKFATYIKERANYICEICWRLPFIQKNWNLYAEADHIEQISTLSSWVDHPDNMRCLCSQCHAIMTHWNTDSINNISQ